MKAGAWYRDAGWRCTAAATVLVALAVGSRSAFGLFLSPLNTATGLGLAAIGFAAALGQLGQGVAQPFVSMLAERHGAARIIATGGAGFALATALITTAADAVAMAFLVLLTGIAGSAMGSIAMLLGEIGKRVPAQRHGLAMGIVGAGGSAGQLLLAPMTQAAIDLGGWASAIWMTAALGLLSLPVALVFRRPASSAGTASGAPVARDASASDASASGASASAASANGASGSGARGDLAVNDGGVRAALCEPAFWLIGGGFAICGFHMSFLTMHMPGVIEGCGLPAALAGVWLAVLGFANIAGSVVIGLVLKRQAAATLLTALHALRAFFITMMLALPASPAVMLGFAIAMGSTYMAALPPTTILVTQAFGARRLATIFGVVMLLHQIGGFTGAWLGGLAAELDTGYRTLWLLDIALALLAAAIYAPMHRSVGRVGSGSVPTPRTA